MDKELLLYKKKLLKRKKLNGEDVGKAMIMENIYNFSRNLEGKESTGIFTEEERGNMVHNLILDKDNADYRSYINIESTLRVYHSLLQASIQGCYGGYYRLFSSYIKISEAERAIAYQKRSPLVMTQKQYEEERRQSMAVNLERKTSYQELIYTALHYFLSNPGNPVEQAVKDMGEEPITNHRIIESYQEVIEPRDYDRLFLPPYFPSNLDGAGNLRSDTTHKEPPQELTKRELLEKIHYPMSMKQLYGDYFIEFIQDYTKVYEALQKEITSHPELASLIETTDYQKETIPWKVLYEGDLYGYGELLEEDSFLFRDYHAFTSIAIVKDPPAADIDEKGHYRHPYQGQGDNPFFKGVLALSKDEEEKQSIQYSREGMLIYSYRITLAMNLLFTLLGERLGIPELEIYTQDLEPIEGMIESFNMIIGTNLIQTSAIEDQEEKKRKTAIVHEVFPPIDLSKYQITEKNIDEAKKLLKDLSLIDYYIPRVVDILRGEV